LSINGIDIEEILLIKIKKSATCIAVFATYCWFSKNKVRSTIVLWIILVFLFTFRCVLYLFISRSNTSTGKQLVHLEFTI